MHQAKAKDVVKFIKALGFDPDMVLEIKVDPDNVTVFYGDAETQTARVAKMPILEIIYE